MNTHSKWMAALIALALAATTLAVAATLWLAVPDKPSEARGAGLAEQLAGVRSVFSSRHFWRYAPMGLLFTGGFMALQGLWAVPWLMQVNGLSRAVAADHLAAMSVAMFVAYALIGLLCTVSLAGAAWALWDRHRQDPWVRLQRRVAERLGELGVPVLPHDPPRTRAERVRGQLGDMGLRQEADGDQQLGALLGVRVSASTGLHTIVAELWQLPLPEGR